MAVHDLMNPGSSQGPLREGIIAKDATSLDEAVEVTIPGFDPHIRWGPCPWSPRHNDDGDILGPAAGDPCAVALIESDEEGATIPVVVSWWGDGVVLVESSVGSVADGSDLHYTHIQGTPSDEWIIPHGLGKYPAIDFIDTAGTQIYGEIIHDSLDQARGLFLAPFIGKAIAN